MQAHVALLLGTLHWISPSSRRAVTLLATYGKISASGLARSVGLRNRYQLARTLAHDGLPPLKALRTWVRLVLWMMEWERARVSLFRSAISHELEPATCYRAVKKTTGSTWNELRRMGGLSAVLMKLRDSCRIPVLADLGFSKRQLPLSRTYNTRA
jgi:hypothetical protein